MLKRALEAGLRVFPLRKGRKIPAITGWQEKATSDPAQVSRWQQKWPGCGWGVATGPSRLVVVDIDDDIGEMLFDLLVGQYCALPSTLEIGTKRGRHLYFRGQCRSRIGALAKVDVKSAGGFTVLYDSVLADRLIADAPEWLTDWAGAPRTARHTDKTAGEIDHPANLGAAERLLTTCEAAVEGAGGDNTTYQTACLVRDLGVSRRACYELMSLIYNPRCEPPWDETDLATKIENAYEYAKGVIGEASPMSFPDDLPPDPPKPLSLLDRINEEHVAVVDRGKFLIYRHTLDGETGHVVWTSMSVPDFKNSLAYLRVKQKKKEVGAGEWWITSPHRRMADAVTFDPSAAPGLLTTGHFCHSRNTPALMLNLWEGWAIEPALGDWSAIRQELIHDILADQNSAAAEYILNWCAQLVQKPHLPGEAALVFRGLKGVGKTTLGLFLMRIAGRHAVKVASSDGLTGQFNGHMLNKIFLLADEAYWAGDKRGEGKLKDFLTGEQLPVRALYRDTAMARNRLHIMMASNNHWVVPATAGDERRYAVFDVPPHQRGNRAFWTRIYDCAENGGLAAMLHDLQHRDIKGWHPQDIPGTKALADQKERSMGVEGEWWREVLDVGRPPAEVLDGEWLTGSIALDKDDVYRDYCDFATRPITRVRLYKDFLTRIGVVERQLTNGAARGRRIWSFPSLFKCRQRWEDLIGLQVFEVDLL
jgi:hypothetical protein